jgi:hypothetical protein
VSTEKEPKEPQPKNNIEKIGEKVVSEVGNIGRAISTDINKLAESL